LFPACRKLRQHLQLTKSNTCRENPTTLLQPNILHRGPRHVSLNSGESDEINDAGRAGFSVQNIRLTMSRHLKDQTRPVVIGAADGLRVVAGARLRAHDSTIVEEQ